MKVRCNGNAVCGSQRDKDKIVAWELRLTFLGMRKAEQGKQSLLGSQFVYISVLSDDFAAVDVREELC